MTTLVTMTPLHAPNELCNNSFTNTRLIVVFILSTLSSHSRMRGSPDSKQAYPLKTISAFQLTKVSYQSGEMRLMHRISVTWRTCL